MSKQAIHRESGFTIVETLIVLAIAGLIMLIVFEAIPALQRSSRNNERRQDVQTVLAAISHYELNNAGNMPGDGSNFLQHSKLAYYNDDSAHVAYIPPNAAVTGGVNVYIYDKWRDAPGSIAATTDLETVNVYNHEKCDPSHPNQATRVGAGYSDVVALYAIETGHSTTGGSQCQQL